MPTRIGHVLEGSTQNLVTYSQVSTASIPYLSSTVSSILRHCFYTVEKNVEQRISEPVSQLNGWDSIRLFLLKRFLCGDLVLIGDFSVSIDLGFSFSVYIWIRDFTNLRFS